MARTSALARILQLSWHDRLLLFEAITCLAVASAAIALLPFKRVAALASRPMKAGSEALSTDVSRLTWAVNACADRVPWKAVCFQRGLAVHQMLRRRGRPSVLHYGVTKSPAKGLEAHVWITCDGDDVIGGEEARRFTCLATFPSSGA